MGMTITQKILADHAGRREVYPGELITCKVDIALANDVTAPIAIERLKELGAQKVCSPDKVVLVPDHFVPAKDIKTAQQVKLMRQFARDFHIKHFWQEGRAGIEHVLLPEQGVVAPGDVVVGADSHTCTYGAIGAFSTGVGSTDIAYTWLTGEIWFKVPEQVKFIYYGRRRRWVCGKDLILYVIGMIGVDGALYKTMEHTGEAIRELGMDDRFTICNMAVEAGAKNGIIEPDEKTLKYVKNRVKREFKFYKSDPDAEYQEVYEVDVSRIEPQVALPYLPSNTKPVTEVTHITVDQVVIGSCTNGRLSDLRVAAHILKGKKVNPNVRCIVIPGTWQVYRQALKEGLIDVFLSAECVVAPPTCGPCLGGHMGVLADGERALATTNRNFVGRMGHPGSEVYLASPAVASATAVLGRIAHPDEVSGEEEPA